MSLFDRSGNTPSTVIIREITRSRNESFGQSVMNDALLAAGPAAKITNNVYRKKALKAIDKRNAMLGNQSEYLNMLCNMNVGDNVSISGNMSEANFFNYITSYCQMEMLVHKRNMALGNVSPSIEEKFKNPPSPTAGHMAKIAFIRGIEAECARDMAKNRFSKV